MVGDMGLTSGLKKSAPGVEDAEPVFQIPVGLPCLERGRLIKKSLPRYPILLPSIDTPFLSLKYISMIFRLQPGQGSRMGPIELCRVRFF